MGEKHGGLSARRPLCHCVFLEQLMMQTFETGLYVYISGYLNDHQLPMI